MARRNNYCKRVYPRPSVNIGGILISRCISCVEYHSTRDPTEQLAVLNINSNSISNGKGACPIMIAICERYPRSPVPVRVKQQHPTTKLLNSSPRQASRNPTSWQVGAFGRFGIEKRTMRIEIDKYCRHVGPAISRLTRARLDPLSQERWRKRERKRGRGIKGESRRKGESTKMLGPRERWDCQGGAPMNPRFRTHSSETWVNIDAWADGFRDKRAGGCRLRSIVNIYITRWLYDHDVTVCGVSRVSRRSILSRTFRALLNIDYSWKRVRISDPERPGDFPLDSGAFPTKLSSRKILIRYSRETRAPQGSAVRVDKAADPRSKLARTKKGGGK